MKFDPNELLWEQKYRPQTIEDCVLPQSTKDYFTAMVARGEISNMLLCSTCPGTGKTTVARALMNDLNYEYIFKAAGTGSGEGGIQAMRDIEDYASCISVTGKKKAVIIDEADNLTVDAQSALRNIIERYSKTIRFILTANYPEKLMKPLHSRLQTFVFEIKDAEAASVKKQMIKRCIQICENEGVKVTSTKALAALVSHHYPDNRSVMVSLQTYARTSSEIDEGLLATLTNGSDLTSLIEALKTKNVGVIRSLAPQYKHNFSKTLSEMYRQIYPLLHPSTIPNFIQIIGEANNNFNTCADIEILIVWMMVMIIMECKFS